MLIVFSESFNKNLYSNQYIKFQIVPWSFQK